jgi:heat shock protein HslJ
MELKALVKLSWLPLVVGLAACAGSGAGIIDSTALPPGNATDGSGAQAASALAGRWKLVRVEKAGQDAIDVEYSDRFTAEFSASRVTLTADCNVCTGAYTATPDTLSVGPMACTRAYCPSAPLDSDFAMLVSDAERWSVAGSHLTLSSPKGTLLLSR